MSWWGDVQTQLRHSTEYTIMYFALPFKNTFKCLLTEVHHSSVHLAVEIFNLKILHSLRCL